MQSLIALNYAQASKFISLFNLPPTLLAEALVHPVLEHAVLLEMHLTDLQWTGNTTVVCACNKGRASETCPVHRTAGGGHAVLSTIDMSQWHPWKINVTQNSTMSPKLS